MKISDIRAVLSPTHDVCIETNNADEDLRKILYLGVAANIPGILNAIDVTTIEANDFMQLTAYIDEKSVS